MTVLDCVERATHAREIARSTRDQDLRRRWYLLALAWIEAARDKVRRVPNDATEDD